MNNIKNMIIDIDGTEFLEIINNKIERDEFIQKIENDLIDISETKKLHLDNIQSLMTYLTFTQESNTHYYEGLVFLLENTDLNRTSAINMMDEIMEEDENLYIELLNHFAPDVIGSNDKEVV